MGHPDSRIFRASGMVLHPRFYDCPPANRAGGRARLGLQPDLTTGLVLFGGEGSMDAVKVVRSLNGSGLPLQLIVLCGRHEQAELAVRSLERRIPVYVQGFTRDVPSYMALADFFIGKPGPGSVSEALAMGLPVVVERNAWTLAQERYNATWVAEQEVGLVCRNFAHVAGPVREFFVPGRLERFRAKAAALRNHAVFEVPAILEAVLEHHPKGTGVVARRQVIEMRPGGSRCTVAPAPEVVA